VAVTPTANACVRACTVTVTGGLYTDTCDSVTGLTYCQPIGPQGEETLVCLSRLDANTSPLPDTNDLCTLVEIPCRPGAACLGGAAGYCRQYCDMTANDISGVNSYCPNATPFCCQVTSGAQPLYAVCMPGSC
jgi:hypothetical protein